MIGGYHDEEFKEPSRRLIQRFASGRDLLILSSLTLVELRRAPAEVRDVLHEIPDEFIQVVQLSNEATELADQYVAAGVVGESSLVDAQHIALAAVHPVDVLVSWNFRHIVNLDKIRGYNSINLRCGYSLVEIRSPMEVIDYE